MTTRHWKVDAMAREIVAKLEHRMGDAPGHAWVEEYVAHYGSSLAPDGDDEAAFRADIANRIGRLRSPK